MLIVQQPEVHQAIGSAFDRLGGDRVAPLNGITYDTAAPLRLLPQSV